LSTRSVRRGGASIGITSHRSGSDFDAVMRLLAIINAIMDETGAISTVELQKFCRAYLVLVCR
jgi:hypothetical protein